ncbi:translation initiation factor IF-2, partial [Planctomycetota bacterium]
VFVDTPGHAAFTEMRARGANVTDVVVLVVAADDGVMPQTEEAYSHAKAADAPIVVAINKIDKVNANVMKVKQQLSALGLQPVDWGGDTEVLEVSALKGEGIDNLLETLWLQAEILELKADPGRAASGTCLEARKSVGRGVVANLLVQDGSLKRGDTLICGSGYGRVRAIFNDLGKKVKQAGPSTPVEVIGLETVPEASAKFYVLDDLSKAKGIADVRMQRKRIQQLAERSAMGHMSLESLFDRMQKGLAKEIKLILKADSRGSIEVLQKELPALSTDEVKVKILHSGVGGITESDVLLADASDAIIIGFNVVADDKARSAADLKGVDVHTYRVIYQVMEELKKAMERELEPEEREVVTATLDVRKTFKASAIGTIAGCYVTKGKVERQNRIRLVREGIIKYEGDIASLKRVKDDAKEVREGFECGLVVQDYNDVQVGDVLEAFKIEKIARTLATT